jgi:hypothetical protein
MARSVHLPAYQHVHLGINGHSGALERGVVERERQRRRCAVGEKCRIVEQTEKILAERGIATVVVEGASCLEYLSKL